MDAIVIVDPVRYQRRRDERGDVSMPLRSLHFGPDGGGSVTFLVYPLMISCLSSRSSGSAVNADFRAGGSAQSWSLAFRAFAVLAWGDALPVGGRRGCA